MKKLASIILTILLLSSLASCSAESKSITCDEIIAAYEKAGYEVFHNEDGDFDYDCYIKVESADGEDDIFFHHFATAEEAEKRGDEREYNILIWLFSVIYGDPMWVHTEVYGNYEIEYTDKTLYQPFKELTK